MDNGKTILRELAEQYMEIASSPEMEVTIRRWKETVAGRETDRSPVMLRLNCSQNEIIPLETLQCTEPFMQNIERRLRWSLFIAGLGSDEILYPYFSVNSIVRLTNPPLFGVEIDKEHSESDKGAWKTIPPIQSEADLDKLRMSEFEYDEQTTRDNIERTETLIGDIIDIRRVGNAGVSAIFDNDAEMLLGYNELLLNVVMNPDMLHRIMAFLRDNALNSMDQIEEMGILTDNSDQHKFNSYSLKSTPYSVPATFKESWIWTNSQIFGAVGPEHFKEFLLDYQMPILERFGALSYGCCENLTDKIDYILQIPNLKIFVNSSWTDIESTAPKCADRSICIEWRQMATEMMGNPDFSMIDQKIRHGLNITENQNRYIVMQEIETVEGNVDKFREWCRIAVTAAEEAS